MGSPENDIYAEPPCHPRACAIQECLTRNNYNDAKCKEVIKALYACCEAFYRKQGDDATTPSCPQPNLLRLKLQQMRDGTRIKACNARRNCVRQHQRLWQRNEERRRQSRLSGVRERSEDLNKHGNVLFRDSIMNADDIM